MEFFLAGNEVALALSALLVSLTWTASGHSRGKQYQGVKKKARGSSSSQPGMASSPPTTSVRGLRDAGLLVGGTGTQGCPIAAGTPPSLRLPHDAGSIAIYAAAPAPIPVNQDPKSKSMSLHGAATSSKICKLAHLLRTLFSPNLKMVILVLIWGVLC
jgi:hypothetical protein